MFSRHPWPVWLTISAIALSATSIIVMFLTWPKQSDISLTEPQQLLCRNAIIEQLYTPKTAEFDNMITSKMDSLTTVLIQQSYQSLAVQIENWKKTDSSLYITVGSVTMTNFYGVDVTRRFICIGTTSDAEAFLNDTNLYLY